VKETDIAWAAGLFEGEGCISREGGSRGGRRWRLIIQMNDRDVVDRYREIVEQIAQHQSVAKTYIVNPRKYYRDGFDRQVSYCYKVARRASLLAILTAFLPYLGQRRSAKVREALEELLKDQAAQDE
jgi:hypothetical protein